MKVIPEVDDPKIIKFLDGDNYSGFLAISEVHVTPVSADKLRSVQQHLFDDCVLFYEKCIKLGCYPPPCEGIQDSNGLVYLTDGTHRATAWIRLHWIQVPVRIWGPIIE